MEDKKEYYNKLDKSLTIISLIIGYPIFLIFAIAYGVWNGVKEFHKSLRYYF